MYCKICGTKVENDVKFCPKCGFNINFAEEKHCPYNEESQELGILSILKLSLTKNYCQFEGRSTRKEWWILTIAIYIITAIVTNINEDISLIISLALIMPQLGMWVRRLHDVNKSGWWVIGIIIPIFNLYLLYLAGIKKGTPFYNKYGPVVQNVSYTERR